METVFSRLRRLEASKDRSLHEMIVDACDAGDALVEALERIKLRATPHQDDTAEDRQRNLFHVDSIARRALASAYVNDSHTPDNGARAA